MGVVLILEEVLVVDSGLALVMVLAVSLDLAAEALTETLRVEVVEESVVAGTVCGRSLAWTPRLTRREVLGEFWDVCDVVEVVLVVG